MSKKQTLLQSHLETLTQNIVGLIIGFIILSCWGLSPAESASLQTVILISSNVRSYVIRRLFNKYGSN